MHEIKDLFGIQVIVSVNVIHHDVGEYLDYENCKCRKILLDKLTEECTESIDEVKIAECKKHYKGIDIYYIGYIKLKKLMLVKIFTV